jgi:pilus assembly protein CpaB
VRANNLIVLFVAIFMGGIAAFLARNWLLNHSQSSSASQTTGTIVVAAAPLGFGVALSESNVAEIPWASRSLPEGAFATKQDLLKDGRRVVLSQLDRNEPVLRSKVTAPGQRGSLSALLDEDKRAVTVRVDDVRGVAGFILPGDRVDVVLIRTENGGGSGNQSYSDIVLEHVKVLAVDQVVNERSEAPAVAKAVTLEVTADEAQKVLLATNVGKLSLILSRPAGASSEAGRRIRERDLGRQEVEAPVPTPTIAEAAPPVRTTSTTVTVIRGERREEYPVQKFGR